MDKYTRNVKKRKNPEEDGKRKLPPLVKYISVAAAVIILIVAGIIIYFNIQNSYVAVVDGEKITTGQYKCYLEMQSQSMYLNAYAIDNSMTWDTFWSTEINGEDPKEYAKKIALKSAKEARLQYIKAKEAGIKLTNSELKYIDDYIQTNIVDKYGDGLKLKANKELEKEYGFTMDDFRKVQIETYTISKYWSSEITDEDIDIEKWYSQKPEWFKGNIGYRTDMEEAVWLKYIMIACDEDSATQDEKTKAETKANELISKLKGGADFAEVAKESSEIEDMQIGSGELILGKGDFIAELDEAAFSLDEGEITEKPVKTNNGYYILQLEEKIPQNEPVSLRCAKEFSELGTSFVRNKIIDERVEEWMNKAQIKDNTAVYNSITIPEEA